MNEDMRTHTRIRAAAPGRRPVAVGAARRAVVATALAALATAVLAPASHAQAWPAKAVTIVSPYPAGGITDRLSRIVAEELTKSLGQQVLVENRTGAGGAIAMAHVAKAAPDGYTLVMGGSAPTAIIPAVNPSITYRPENFAPIGYVAGLPIVLVAHPSVPAPDLKAFIAHVRANGATMNCAHHGSGTGTHLACLQFDAMIGAKSAQVPYRGAPQVNQDLLAGRVQFYFGTLPTQIQLVRSGQLRAYGVASHRRAPAAPEIPTLAEQGLPGLIVESWNALYAPAGTPVGVIAKLSDALRAALERPEVRARIEATGSTVQAGSADELRRLTDTEYATYRKLAVDANIKVN